MNRTVRCHLSWVENDSALPSVQLLASASQAAVPASRSRSADRRSLSVVSYAPRMRRMLGLGIFFLFLVACTSSSEGQTSKAQTSPFLGLGEPELFDGTDSFGVGCPNGWSYQDASGMGVPAIRFQPAEPLPGGIDSVIFAAGGSRIELDVQVPDDPESLLEQLTRLFDADVDEQYVGKWDDRDAVWFRGRVQDDFLSTEEKVDGFVAAVKDSAGEWRGYLIDSYPQGVYEAALSEVVAGFQPVDLQAIPSIDPSMEPMSGTCEGVFGSVSPPLVQRTEGDHRHVRHSSHRPGDRPGFVYRSHTWTQGLLFASRPRCNERRGCTIASSVHLTDGHQRGGPGGDATIGGRAPRQVLSRRNEAGIARP